MEKLFSLLATIICLAIGANAQPLKSVSPEKVGLDSERLQSVDQVIEQGIQQGFCPGAVLAVVRHGKMAYLKAYGNQQVYPDTVKMSTETIFDMASCSKSMSTAISTMILEEQGKIRLLDPVNQYLPDFEDWSPADGKEKQAIRIWHLLTHSSGLHPYVGVSDVTKKYGSPNPDGLMEYICHMKRDFEPGTDFQYSCLNFVTLQNIIQAISGQSLRDFAQENIFRPLGMSHTDYLPCSPDANGIWQNISKPVWAKDEEDWRKNVAPTEKQADDKCICGMVHDPLARLCNGGISGNAGLFTTAGDVAILCAALQNGGEWNGHRILSPLTVKTMRTVPSQVSQLGRALGWDVCSDYSSNKGDLLSPETYCHTGFTGPSIVIDPVNDISIIFLTNAVHPTGHGGMVRLRSLVSNAVASSIVK